MVLVYLGDEDSRIIELIHSCDCIVYGVGDSEKNKYMKDLIETPTVSKEHGSCFIYLVDEKPEKIELIIETLKAHQLYVPRMAKANLDNLNWTLKDLIVAVDDAYQCQMLKSELASLLNQLDVKRLDSDKEYAHLIRHAVAAYEDEDASNVYLRQLIDTLRRW